MLRRLTRWPSPRPPGNCRAPLYSTSSSSSPAASSSSIPAPTSSSSSTPTSSSSSTNSPPPAESHSGTSLQVPTRSPPFKWSNTPRAEPLPENFQFKSGPRAGMNVVSGPLTRPPPLIPDRNSLHVPFETWKQGKGLQKYTKTDNVEDEAIDRRGTFLLLTIAAVIGAFVIFTQFRVLLDPGYRRELVREDKKKLIEMSHELKTLQVNTVLERITSIEEELRRRGVEVPKTT